MAKLLSNIFKPGWSTSKPGDMKNPSHMGMDHISNRMPHLAKRSMTTSVKPTGVFTAGLEKMNADESRRRNQEKLHRDFAEMLASTHVRQLAAAEAQLAEEAAQRNNPDRPQTAMDAW